MSSDADETPLIGINWGSRHLRAWHIAGDSIVDEYAAPTGIAGLDRAGMEAVFDSLISRWPEVETIFAAGMIGSNIGWTETPYAEAPVDASALAAAMHAVHIAGRSVLIVPGIACRRDPHGAPDVLRGEEVELLGAIACGIDGVVVIPGAHSKWVDLSGGRIGAFVTNIATEICDQMSKTGLLASVVEGDVVAGTPLRDGFRDGRSSGLGLGTLLFGARAQAVRALRPRTDLAAYIRGLAIGSEVADAGHCFGRAKLRAISLIAAEPLRGLYTDALSTEGIACQTIDPHRACVTGFRSLYRAFRNPATTRPDQSDAPRTDNQDDGRIALDV